MGGRYRLEQVLRCGPGRCEHRAHDELLRRTVTTVIAEPASPEPLPDAVTLPISARTEHGPGLAEVYDGGGEDGVLYLVVARAEGACLADDLAAGPLPVPEVRALGVQIARVLLPVHRHGYAHGALGAQLVTRGPSGVTVAGLGVEEWLRRWAHQRCDPPHPAPEQRAARSPISPATDVYALGRLLGAAAGRLPRSEPLRAVLRAMTARDPTSRPDTRAVIDLLGGRRRPGADDEPAGPGRALAGTLSTLALAGALAVGGLAAHMGPSGLLGGATLGWPSSPSRVADRPPAHAPADPGSSGDEGGSRPGEADGVTEARVSNARVAAPRITGTQATRPRITETRVPHSAQSAQPRVPHSAQSAQPRVTPTQATEPRATPRQAPEPRITETQVAEPQVGNDTHATSAKRGSRGTTGTGTGIDTSGRRTADPGTTPARSAPRRTVADPSLEGPGTAARRSAVPRPQDPAPTRRTVAPADQRSAPDANAAPRITTHPVPQRTVPQRTVPQRTVSQRTVPPRRHPAPRRSHARTVPTSSLTTTVLPVPGDPDTELPGG
ncbi:hypothetical protein [Actinomycetospora sp. TBRC 11914]|uniref:hypothetical protein n=1 Tax=Actinomycetospora sp. TBRC 11914 TaxID=2729387 RepID=UPI00145D48DC|nr:hypothetical protein [Actinomycetospora sp. TBRC 11914]NMO89454.1 hypothetical protein [Actinomycetospora sp. TBRC 11914]